MKKTFTLLLLIALLLTLAATSASAEEIRQNVFTSYNVYPYHQIGLKTSISAYIPEYVCDGNINYREDDSGTFCDHLLAASQKTVQQGKAPLYDLAGNTGTPEAKYLCILFFELNQLYILDGFTFYGTNALNGVPYIGNVDGVDILLSETGLDDDWKLVYSETELLCGKKYQARNTLYEQTAYITADFEATKAQYIAFGLTQPRCQHADALKAAYNLEIATHPEYFRITELEFYGAPENAPETTREVVSPAVTDAPTPTAPTPATLNYEAILITVLLMGMAIAALLVAREIKRHPDPQKKT